MRADIPDRMQALQLKELGHLDLVEIPVPSPEEGELLIRTAASTICTSDLNDIAQNPFWIPLPRVPGHEGAGTVAALGERVSDARVGDKVAAHPVIPCGFCQSCRRGLGHLCDNMGHLGIDRDGTFAEYFCLRADRVRVVPEGMDMAVAGLLEPVAVCLEALCRTRVAAGDTVLVVGDGPFGIIITRLALRRSPGKVIVVGRHDFRLGYAGGAVCINERHTEDVRVAIMKATDGAGVDAAILAAASEEAVSLCIEVLRPRGRVSVFASLLHPVPVDLFRVQFKELEILGACNDEDYLDESLACLADQMLRLGEIVTHRLPFADWERAFQLASRGKDEALKVAITWD